MKKLLIWLVKFVLPRTVTVIPNKKIKLEFEKRSVAYERELEAVCRFLTPIVGNPVTWDVIDDRFTAEVRLFDGSVVAHVKPFPKGESKRQTYIKVELFQGYEACDIWFQLVFFGFRVYCTKPVLLLQGCEIEHPRGP